MLNQLIQNVHEWATARNIIKGSTPIKQHDKLLEEVMELRDAIVSNGVNISSQQVFEGKAGDFDMDVKDAIGDCTVCLLNLTSMYNMEFIQEAYDEVKGSTLIKQHDKLLEKVMELRDGIIYHNLENSIGNKPSNLDESLDKIKYAIGDCTVCLINLASMHDMDFVECLQSAYDEIKDRKGILIDGKFIKESDLMTPENIVS